MKRIFILISISLVLFAAVVIGGLLTADKTKYQNDFIRLFPPHAADIDMILKIKSHRTSLVDISNETFLSDPRGLLIVETDGDTTRVPLEIPFGYTIIIDSPFFYLQNGATGTLKRGDIHTWKLDTAFANLPGFTAIQIVASNDAIVQTINIAERQNVLLKRSGTKKHVLQKQIDGLLCTDGLLQFSKSLNQLIYIYRYRNQFIYLDTALNVVKYGRTIDTTSVAKISVAEIDGKITMSSPPFAVNNDACVDDKYLFVQSNLLAKNELPARAKGKSVVDVYNLVDGSYRFSFYIEDHDGSKMKEFKVRGSKLVALFEQAVITYTLPEKYLP